MCPDLLWLTFALAIVNGNTLTFDLGKKYQYEYNANIRMEQVDEVIIYAQVSFINIGNRDDGQELSFRIENFTITSESNDDVLNQDHSYDLTHWFSFVITNTGEIIRIFHNENENQDVLTLKKGIVNLLSGKFLETREADHSNSNGTWFYKTSENGHEGEHNASYRVEPTLNGNVYTKQRIQSNNIPSHAESSAIKHVVIDHHLGTIHSVTSIEHVEAKHKAKPEFDPFQGMRKVETVSDFEELDIPAIKVGSICKLTFAGVKDARVADERPEDLVLRLITHDVSENQSGGQHPQSENVTSLLKSVNINLKCIRDQPETGSREFLRCSTELANTLLALPNVELEALTERIFNPSAKTLLEQTIYKEAILDSLFMINTELAQTLIVKHTLRNRSLDKDLFQRSLFHLGSVQPIYSVIQRYVASILDEPVDVLYERYGSEDLHIMLLAFGSVSRTLMENENGMSTALKFNKKIKDMLGIHDPYTYRLKRSTLTEEAALDFDWRKVVYLEALGNERHSSSFEYITSHANSSISSWVKRAAVHALRHYNESEAAKIILIAATKDENPEVRHEAMIAYKTHPAYKYSSFKTSERYMFRLFVREGIPKKEHSRHTRGILDKELTWSLKVPGVDWRRAVGSQQLGAAFGVILMNNFDLRISALSGHFKVEIHDEVYARAIIGILDIVYDFFSARICFKGGAEYNLNLLQEFNSNLNVETVKLLTEGIRDVANAIKTGTDTLTEIINGKTSLKLIIDDFLEVFRSLPEMVLDIRDAALNAAKEFGDLILINLPPFLQPMKYLVDYVANLMSDVKMDVLDFFYMLVQIVETRIPNAVKQIFRSVKSITEQFPNIFKDPLTTVARIGKCVLRIAFSIVELKSVRKQILSSSFIKGKKPYWMDLKQIFEHIKQLTQKAFESFMNGAQDWVEETSEADDPIAALTDGKMSQKSIRETIVGNIDAIIEKLIAPFERLTDIGNGFIDKFFKIFDLVSEIQTGFNTVRTGFKAARSLMNKIFGPKFHKDFPKLLREADTCPKNGFFPSKNDGYTYNGIDIVVAEGTKIVSPLSGEIQSTETSRQVRLSNIAELPDGQDILIDNIELGQNKNGEKWVAAGDIIGTVTRSQCTNHIHVALRDKNGAVMDPSRLLAPRPPTLPEWKQSCNDKRVVFKGDTKVVGRLVEGIEVVNKSEHIEDDANHPIPVNDNQEPSITDNEIYNAVTTEKSNGTLFIEKAAELLEVLLERTNEFLSQFSIRRIKLGHAVQFLHNLGMTESVMKLAEILKTIKAVLDDTPCVAPSQMTDDFLQTQLINRGLPFLGNRETLLQTLTNPDTRCPYIALAMHNALNMHCLYANGCLEMQCCVSLEVLGVLQKTYRAFFRIDTDTSILYLGLDNWRKHFPFSMGHFFSSQEETIDTEIKFDLLDARILCKYSIETSNHTLILTYRCGMCAIDKEDVCINWVDIVEDAIFRIPYVSSNGTVITPEVDFESYFDRERIKDQLEVAGESLLEDGKSFIADKIFEIFGIPDHLLKANPKCTIPGSMEPSDILEELNIRGLSTDGTPEELKDRLTSSDTTCTTITDHEINFPRVNEAFQDIFVYRVSKSCMRFDACLDTYLPILDVTKTFSAAIELDTCNFKMYLEIENLKKIEWHIDFEWGKEATFYLTEDFYLRYAVDKTHTEFILTVSLVVERINFELTFIELQHIPIPICNEDFKLPGAGDLFSFANSMSGRLSQDAFDVFTEYLGINDFIQNKEKCVLPQDPKNCDQDPTSFIPTHMKDIMHCKLLDNCWGVSCCLQFDFPIPLSDIRMHVSMPFMFKYDPCQYYLEMNAGINYKITKWLVVYKWGEVNTLRIGKRSASPITISYSIDKSETGFTVDVNMSICLPLSSTEISCIPDNAILYLLENENISTCSLEIDITSDREYPDFSLTDWLTYRGQNITDTLGEAGREYILEALNLDDILIQTSCDKTRTPYSPSVNGWNMECSMGHVKQFSLPKFVACHVSANCQTISCCIDLPQIDISVMVSVDLDLCQNEIVARIENVTNRIERAMSVYKWGVPQTVSIGGVFHLSYTITLPATSAYIVNIGLRVCFEKNGSCIVDTKLITDLEIPRIYCRSSEIINNHIENTPQPCSMDADLQGINCNAKIDEITTRMVYLRLEPCLDSYIYSVGELRWEFSFSSLQREMDNIQEIEEGLSLIFSLEVSGMFYFINIEFEKCSTSEKTDGCDSVLVLSRFPLFKTECSTKRRRKRRSVDEETLANDIQMRMEELYGRKASNKEIMDVLNDMKIQQDVFREESFKTLYIEDSDSETKASSLVKAMGKGNPMSILHASEHTGWEVEVTGGEAILDILNKTVKAIGKGHQLYVAGSGLTEYGVVLLGNKLANMTIGDLGAFLELNKVDPAVVHKLIIDLVDLAKSLYTETVSLLTSGRLNNAFDGFDMTLRGSFKYPLSTGNLFKYRSPGIPLGPVFISFEFGSDYFLGIQFGAGIGFMSRVVEASVTPYTGLSVWGGASIGFILYAEIRLTGYILDIRFPTYAELDFARFPIDIGLKMDLAMIPLRLQLYGLVTLKINLLFKTIKKTLFRATLWSYQAPSINKNIIDSAVKEEDLSPPEFQTITNDEQNIDYCVVKQLPGYDYTEPEFELMVAAQDDKSQVKFFLDVGTYPGGFDTLTRFQLGGALTRLTMSLGHTGVPLYFTVYAQNSQGLRSSVSCMLTAYDITIPTGRVKADYLSSSNPHVLTAFITVHDESQLVETHLAVGYGEDMYGDQIVPWHSVEMDELDYDPVQETDFEQSHPIETLFSGMVNGRLVGEVLESRLHIETKEECALLCLRFPRYSCLSINYDFGTLRTCEILNAAEGHDNLIVKDGFFGHYERIGTGQSLEVILPDLNLEHNLLYVINLNMMNSLGYTNAISSSGVLIDLNPPVPGYANNVETQHIEHVPCLLLIPEDRQDLDRLCIGLNHKTPNNIVVHDGPTSAVVFNGRQQLFDQKYTRINTYISGSWDGFHDNETSIRVYSVAVGTTYCGDQIQQHTDPHSHLSSPSEWNNRVQIYPIPSPYTILPDGPYYITVRALNGVEYGGPLAVTVCHTTSFIVDTSHPYVNEIYNITYDEKMSRIYAYMDIGDPHSGISEYDVCFGKTSRYCDLSPWYRYDIIEQPSVNHEFKIPDGIPTWLRIRAVNNVHLSTVGVSNQPLVLDGSAPFPGVVKDGATYKTDIIYSKDSQMICANWEGFHDPESGVFKYLVGIGSVAGGTDIIPLKEVSNKDHFICHNLSGDNSLLHGSRYYATVFAINGGMVKRNVSAISNGVIIDLSPPVAGEIVDGTNDAFEDLAYSSSKSTIAVQWRNFVDPESAISDYSVMISQISTNIPTVIKDWTSVGYDKHMVAWKNVHMEHNTHIQTTVQITNGASNKIFHKTNGFIVDLTSPILKFIYDGITPKQDRQFQTEASLLSVNFEIEDLESGLKTLKFQVHERCSGQRKQIWPAENTWHVEIDTTITHFQVTDLLLISGTEYLFIIASENNAGLTSIHETNGVIVDTTPPYIRWLNIGVLFGDDEDQHNGYVYQSDHAGIKLSYLTYDTQSGIANVIIKVGTEMGADDIKSVTSYDANVKDIYITGLHLTETNLQTLDQVYYVTLQVKNGAGQTSDEVYSTPIVVVPEDVPGIVVDGIFPSGDDIFVRDIDYTVDDTTMFITFNRFKSTLHGIKCFVYAIGTAPDREDVVPFTEHGLTFTETIDTTDNRRVYSGTAQLPVTLEHGNLYYVTIRGITNNGHALQSVTDGIMVDKTPPIVTIDRVIGHAVEELDVEVLYKTGIKSFDASWIIIETELISVDIHDNIKGVTTKLGSFPHGSDTNDVKYWLSPKSDVGEISYVNLTSAGMPYFLAVSVENGGGLKTSTVAPAVVVDDTPPQPGQVLCTNYAQPNSRIHCQWSGFKDIESPIMRFMFYMGLTAGDDDIVARRSLPGSAQEYFINAYEDLAKHGETFYATVVAVNSVNKDVASFSNPIYIDTTAPTPGVVVEVASESVLPFGNNKQQQLQCNTEAECNEYDVICQESRTSVSVIWSPFQDAESGIKTYFIGIGTTENHTDIMGFVALQNLDRVFTVTGLLLNGVAQVYVMIKAVNGAGLSTVSTSNGVYISYISQNLSPLSEIGIWDADSETIGDIDYQVESSVIRAEWDTAGEPCPAVKYEWAIMRLDGEIIQEYTLMIDTTSGYNDQLDMQNAETYYSLLRVTNADGYVYVLRSDGVTIHNQLLVPGSVYDGDVFGIDLNGISSREQVACNWDGFGVVQNKKHEEIITGNKGVDQEKPDNQKISMYEVALGTDRRFSHTRANIVPFTDVGNRISYTFIGLDLDVGMSKYYCTVKAYSTSFSTAQAMSNGFIVTFNGGVIAGQVKIAEYTDSLTTVDVPWLGFESKEDMMVYYVAVSSHFWPTIRDCKQYIDGGNATKDEKFELFDIYTVTSVGRNTFVKLQDVTLVHGQTYNIAVMGVDRSGECNMTVVKTTVDVSKPERGARTVGPYSGMALSYTSDSSVIQVEWTGYTDDVSGIKAYTVSLFYGISCENDEIHEQIGEEYTLDENIHSFTFSDIVLETKRPYFVKLHVTNGAGLVLVDVTEPILLDTSSPSAGRVAEGGTYTDDIVWWGSTTEFTGSILHMQNSTGEACPSHMLSWNDTSWSSLEGRMVDNDGTAWNLMYKHNLIKINHNTGKLQIKMSRDSKSENILSGGIWRKADLENTGSYEIKLKAASDPNLTNYAVTELLFIDDMIEDSIVTNHYKLVTDWSDEDCSCCFGAEEMRCICSNCTAYLEIIYQDYSGKSVKSNQNENAACGLQIHSVRGDPRLLFLKETTQVVRFFINSSYGELQLICLGPDQFGILWCRFVDSKIPIMEMKFDLPEYVADRLSVYRLVFQTHLEDVTSQMCLTAFIDDSEFGYLCGIPVLSSSSNFLIHVWNGNRFLPNRIHPLSTWNAYAEVESIIFPPAIGELCRYGNPFRGGDIPIIRYEAAIGSAPGLSDIHPFEEVYYPCVPCTDMCSKYNCDGDCDIHEDSQLNLTLYGLELQSYTDTENATDLIVNYLTVKAVLGSGRFVISSSNGFYVDTTPPVFDELAVFYIDVDQGEYIPVHYQGSNSTIKATWLCYDNESEIKEYFWAIGSSLGLEDIQQYTSTGHNPSGTNDSLQGILTDNSQYYISIICENEAGLQTRLNDTNGVVVLLTAPDPDTVVADIVGAEKFDYDINPPDALKTDDPTSVGASWKVSEDNGINRYDFCLGSSIERPEDILKCLWVGNNASGEVKIENGSLLYNGQIMYNLNELKYDSSASSTGGAFNMEPGRVIFVSIRACNEAVKCFFKHIGTVTIVSNSRTFTRISNGNNSLSFTTTLDNSDGRKKRSVPISIQLVTPQDLPQGETVMLKLLTNDDLSTVYTSSPSTDFVPYIVNPNTTMHKLERLLVGRIQEFQLSFSVVTIGQFELPGPMEISFTQTNMNPLPGEMINMLIHWNTADQEWKSTALVCKFEKDRETQNELNSSTTVKVCNTRTSGNDTDAYFKEATQFVVILAKVDVVNNAPYLESPTNLTFNEDQAEEYTYHLTSGDLEGDLIKYTLLDSIHGSFVEDLDVFENGSIRFQLCAHCFGTFSLVIHIHDIPESSEVQSNSTDVIINIAVNNVNDPPNIFLVDDNKEYLLRNDITEEIQIFRDNKEDETAFFTAIVGAYEYDVNDELGILYSVASNGEFVVETIDSAYSAVVDCNESACFGRIPEMSPSVMKWMFARITYRNAADFTGIDTIKVAINDSAGVLSDIITVSIYNLEFPCLNGGFCSGTYQVQCDDPKRLTNFDDTYSCVCPIGWTDIHCGTDVDECLTSPCSTPTVCHNIPGSYTCDFPLYFILMVAVVSVVVLIVILTLIFCRHALPCGRSKGQVRRLLDPVEHAETSFTRYPHFNDYYVGTEEEQVDPVSIDGAWPGGSRLLFGKTTLTFKGHQVPASTFDYEG